MKKFFTLVTAFFMVTAAGAQNTADEKIKAEGPNYVQELMDNFIVTNGVSADGTYVFGGTGVDVTGYIYNLNGTEELIVLGPEKGYMSLGVIVVGITYDGTAFVNENDISYMYNIADGTKTYLESPSSQYGMDVWDVSSDGVFFAGNITSEEGYFCEPLYGEKQDDGTYKIVQLSFPKNDAMGCVAQFSQARFITEDGKYIFGVQADSRGMAGRILVWTKQEDGTFACATPFDEYIYDLSSEQPGEVPEFDDYVTADYETESDLYNQQFDEFIALFDEYERKYSEFTRNSSLDIMSVHKAKRGAVIYAGTDRLVESETGWGEQYVSNPIFYDCETGTVTKNEDIVGKAFEQLPGGGYITYDYSSEMFYKTDAVKKDGTVQEFSEWLKDLTGVDLSDRFTIEMSNPFTGEDLSGVFVGIPYFSHDGKTLVMSGTDCDFNQTTAVITFDRDIFATTATGIRPNVLNKVIYADNKISIGDAQGMAVIYSADGTKCGEMMVNGSADLSSMGAGAYIVNVSTDAGSVTLKVIVR